MFGFRKKQVTSLPECSHPDDRSWFGKSGYLRLKHGQFPPNVGMTGLGWGWLVAFLDDRARMAIPDLLGSW